MKRFNFFNMTADDKTVDIKLYGEIISDNLKELYEWFGVSPDNMTSPSAFKEELAKHEGKNINLHINSPGGDFLVGLELYNALKDHKGHKTAIIDALAASAATIPMCACDTVKMSAAATIMVHCVSTWSGGNRQDLQRDIDMLKSMDDTLANVYEVKTGLTRAEILVLMEKETWLDCRRAKELGFADETDEKLTLPQNVLENIIDNNKRLVACLRDLEHPKEPEPATADTLGKGGSKSILNGKYANIEELEKAYSSLQSEFTRKSRELSDLKAKAEPQPKQEPAVTVPQNNSVNFHAELELAIAKAKAKNILIGD